MTSNLRSIGSLILGAVMAVSLVLLGCYFDGPQRHETHEASFVTNVTGSDTEFTLEPSDWSTEYWYDEPEVRFRLHGEEDQTVEFFVNADFTQANVGDTYRARASITSPDGLLEGDFEVTAVAFDESWRPSVCDTLTIAFGGELTNGEVTRRVIGTAKFEP